MPMQSCATCIYLHDVQKDFPAVLPAYRYSCHRRPPSVILTGDDAGCPAYPATKLSSGCGEGEDIGPSIEQFATSKET